MSKSERVYSAVCLAGALIDNGLSHRDADTFYALLKLDLPTFQTLAQEISGHLELALDALIGAVIEQHETQLRNQAAVLRWDKRKTAYEADRSSWEDVRNDKGDNWRQKPMTAGQRFLASDACILLDIEMPEEMNRGAAAEWLDANCANITIKFGKDK